MTDLSLAAQAVLNAFLGDAENTGLQMDDMRENVAAALRAAADQVVPFPRLPYDSCCDVSAAAIRADLLAIATELEAQ
jgi:hypothetical protein